MRPSFERHEVDKRRFDHASKVVEQFDGARLRLIEILNDYNSHVIVAPNPDIEEPVVATAWNRRMRFDDIDDPRIAEFADTYRNRGRERVDCPI